MPSPTARALLASTALTTLVLMTSPPARADDATWTGAVSENYIDAANWTPAKVPGNASAGTAFFSGGAQTTSVFISVPSFVQSIDAFVIDGASYRFTSAADTVFTFVGAGIVTLNGGSATYINNLALGFQLASSAGSASATITNQPGGQVLFFDNSTGGNAAFINDGTVDFSGSAGPNGDGKLSAGSIAGAGSYILGANELTVGGNGNSTEVSGVISGVGGSLVKAGTGTLLLSGTDTYTGATTVNGGTLAVNGSIAASSGVIVNSGGTLGGTGQLPGVTVNAGGNLAPGNSIGTIAVNGNLQFGAGSFYTVEVSPSSADRTNVTGTATLTGGTVRAVALPGSFRSQTYTILNATGGLGGTTFAGLTVTGSFSPAR